MVWAFTLPKNSQLPSPMPSSKLLLLHELPVALGVSTSNPKSSSLIWRYHNSWSDLTTPLFLSSISLVHKCWHHWDLCLFFSSYLLLKDIKVQLLTNPETSNISFTSISPTTCNQSLNLNYSIPIISSKIHSLIFISTVSVLFQVGLQYQLPEEWKSLWTMFRCLTNPLPSIYPTHFILHKDARISLPEIILIISS